MLKDHQFMVRRGWLVLVVILTGLSCTKQNPRSCADGVCNDPAFPFCDFDGAVGGQPKACVAVDCTAGQFVQCDGNNAIACNADGTNFEVTQCERGCDMASGGCQGCETDNQCANPTPVCDSGTSSCRACSLDDECASRVCDLVSGACVPGTSVVYAAPTGVNTGACTLDQPCVLSRAVTVASTAAVTPVLRLLPGTFIEQLHVALPTTSPLKVVGTGATIGPTAPSIAVAVSGGANVEIRDLVTNDTNGGIECSDPNVMSTVTVHASRFSGSNPISL